MRELLLFRHAKATRDDPSMADHDRDLTPRGVDTARGMGQYLQARIPTIDRVLCSTAVRARSTFDLAFGDLAQPLDRQDLRTLYLAPWRRILEIIRRQPETIRTLMLVGHNPGFEALARKLAGGGDHAAMKELAAKFPTGAVAHLAFAVETWREVESGVGELVGFYRPRELG
jgi:phosphohistidine phosphatase